MELILLLIGASVIGGISLFDFGSDNNDQEYSDELTGEIDPTAMVVTQESPPESLSFTNPLDVAIDEPGPSSSPEQQFGPVPQLAPVDQGLKLYDGISDEEIGYSHNSHGIAHRFYENAVTSEELIGSDGDDTIYVGLGSSVFGGDGSDSIELFVPSAILGEEVSIIQDFEPENDTLTVFLELDQLGTESESAPLVEIKQLTQDFSELLVNGIQIVTINHLDPTTQIAVSIDGHGDDYQDLDGKIYVSSDLDNAPIRIVFQEESNLYGV